jgi:hypothetical protein
MPIAIAIHDSPRGDLHSEMEVESTHAAWVHLYALARQAVPEYAEATLHGARQNNWALRRSFDSRQTFDDVPGCFRAGVEAEVRRLNAAHVAAIDVDAHSLAHDELERCLYDPPFVETLTSAARRRSLRPRAATPTKSISTLFPGFHRYPEPCPTGPGPSPMARALRIPSDSALEEATLSSRYSPVSAGAAPSSTSPARSRMAATPPNRDRVEQNRHIVGAFLQADGETSDFHAAPSTVG